MSKRKGGKWRDRMFRLIWMVQMGRCAKCNVSEREAALELDHTHPLHLGGTNDSENLQLLCCPCHRRKSSAECSARAAARCST